MQWLTAGWSNHYRGDTLSPGNGMTRFHRCLTRENRGEPDLVRQSGYVKGGAARMIAGGSTAVRAYMGAGKPGPDTYDFATDIPPRKNYGFVGSKKVIRDVYWPEGDPGVVDFPSEQRVGIPATVIRP